MRRHRNYFCSILFICLHALAAGQRMKTVEDTRAIQFPDIPGFLTLKCDLHTHTVLSDGSVWPDIRVQEANRDGLDAIAITDHVEYQPHKEDIPHPDRNRGYELASQAAEGSDLIVIHGVEITRSMPPGHANAIFIRDANKLKRDDVMEVFREAKRQDAFVFWNHPAWLSQQKDGIATLSPMHFELINEGLLNGVEIINGLVGMYSAEAFQIALEHGLTLLANSDIHGLVDWQFFVPEGGHRPVTLVFCRDRSAEGIKDALKKGRTVAWTGNTLAGREEYLVPLILASLEVNREEKSLVQRVQIENNSDAEFMVENLSPYALYNLPSVFTLPPHEKSILLVKTVDLLDNFSLSFRILNAYSAPGIHPEITLNIGE